MCKIQFATPLQALIHPLFSTRCGVVWLVSEAKVMIEAPALMLQFVVCFCLNELLGGFAMVKLILWNLFFTLGLAGIIL